MHGPAALLALALLCFGCGGRIALVADHTASGDASADVAPAASSGDTTAPAVDEAAASNPYGCDQTRAPISIIAATASRCTNECIDLGRVARQCECGDFRLKLKDDCVVAVESWTQSVECVANAVLGSRLCARSDSGGDCVGLILPCKP